MALTYTQKWEILPTAYLATMALPNLWSDSRQQGETWNSRLVYHYQYIGDAAAHPGLIN